MSKEPKSVSSTNSAVVRSKRSDITKKSLSKGLMSRIANDVSKHLPSAKHTKIKFNDGSTYEGETYEGETIRAAPHGMGVYTFTDGSKFEGKFRYGLRLSGTFIHPDGSKYEGEFQDGETHGHGTFTYPNGEKYMGEFIDGKFHGKGELISADGIVTVGIWKNDVLIEILSTTKKETD